MLASGMQSVTRGIGDGSSYTRVDLGDTYVLTGFKMG
jgi:hypothetical protein